ncbi:hypothetical protein LV779_26145 [Streptomyces thinghirensis]|nr:hypothetical protein [Streptomyces thinghirensis]
MQHALDGVLRVRRAATRPARDSISPVRGDEHVCAAGVQEDHSPGSRPPCPAPSAQDGQQDVAELTAAVEIDFSGEQDEADAVARGGTGDRQPLRYRRSLDVLHASSLLAYARPSSVA